MRQSSPQGRASTERVLRDAVLRTAPRREDRVWELKSPHAEEPREAARLEAPGALAPSAFFWINLAQRRARGS